MSVKLSLTLPSLFPEPAIRVIENVRATVRDIDYEILLVSPFEVTGPNVRWVREETPKGAGVASAIAYAHSTGDIIFPLADDIELNHGWATEGLKALLRFERDRPYALGVGQTNMIVGTVFGIYYPFFPMVRRATLEAVGGFYLSNYKHHFTDSDFALRIWSIGGACGFTERGYIVRTPREAGASAATAQQLANSRAESIRRDMDVFTQAWAPRYGQGWRLEDLRDFNIDVDAIFRMFVADGNTIYLNDSSFADAHRRYVRNMAGFRLNVQIDVTAVV